jgi:hypothetical protein
MINRCEVRRCDIASLATHGWALESGEARHTADPASFWIPSRAERENVRRGQDVKLLFQIATQSVNGATDLIVERMWVRVKGRVDNLYIGELDDQSVNVQSGHNVHHGMAVVFSAEHIVYILNSIDEDTDVAELADSPRESEWSRR